MPSLDLIRQRKEERMQQQQAAQSGEKTWKDRTCARDKRTAFTPKAAQQKVCGVCEPCLAANAAAGKGKPKPVAKASAPGKATKPVDRIAVAAPTLDGIAHATELLEAAGFRVRAITVPAGVMLLVSGAAA